MYIDDCKYKRNGIPYRRVLLREGYRFEGKSCKKTLANLSELSDDYIEVIKFAIKNKDAIIQGNLQDITELLNGKLVGIAATTYQIALQTGISEALGSSKEAKLCLALIVSRIIDQGSRLSCVKTAENHAIKEIIGLEDFTEDHLYKAMDWLSEQQSNIEKKLFKKTLVDTIYLYDVSSTYLEGTCNEFARFGYNRDKKNGKMQIVYGLLTDCNGEPISIEVFEGNTKDTQTVKQQLEKLRQKFDCRNVTLVGDKGMIKQAQIEDLHEYGFNYITTISKPEIQSLHNKGILDISLFDNDLMEIVDDDIRYIFRKNPLRSEELKRIRMEKEEKLFNIISQANEYLKTHQRAKVDTQIKKISEKLKLYNLDKYATLVVEERVIKILIEQDKKDKISLLDGCYVMKTDLDQVAADKEIIHKRYKDLALVERAFRTCKTDWLEAQPVYVRKKKRTRAHMFIIMLAYKIVRYLEATWKDINVSATNGLKNLLTIGSSICTVKGKNIYQTQKPNQECQKLLDKINVILPKVLPII